MIVVTALQIAFLFAVFAVAAHLLRRAFRRRRRDPAGYWMPLDALDRQRRVARRGVRTLMGLRS